MPIPTPVKRILEQTEALLGMRANTSQASSTQAPRTLSPLVQAIQAVTLEIKMDVGRTVSFGSSEELYSQLRALAGDLGDKIQELHRVTEYLQSQIKASGRESEPESAREEQLSPVDMKTILRRINNIGNRISHLNDLLFETYKMSKSNVQLHLRGSGYDTDVRPQHLQQAEEIRGILGNPGRDLAMHAAECFNTMPNNRSEPLTWSGQKPILPMRSDSARPIPGTSEFVKIHQGKRALQHGHVPAKWWMEEIKEAPLSKEEYQKVKDSYRAGVAEAKAVATKAAAVKEESEDSAAKPARQ